jgi:hypothetical protein
LLVAAAVAVTSIPDGSQTTPAVATSLSDAAAEPANADPEGRPVYPYSIIQGGATSEDELEKAMAADPVVAAHFEGFDLHKTRVETLPEPRVAHVSYRKGNDVFWTRKPVVIPAGETVLTDGSNLARTRCGNRLADSPGPVSDDEPDPTVFDTPGPAFRRETPPIRSVGPVTSNGPSGSFSTSPTGESGPSGRPGPGGGVPGPGFGPPGSSSSGGHNPGPSGGGTTGNPDGPGGNGATSNPNGTGANGTISSPNGGGTDADSNPGNSPGSGQSENPGDSGNSRNQGGGSSGNPGGPHDPFESVPPLSAGSLPPPIGYPDFLPPGPSLTLPPGPPFAPDGPPGPPPIVLITPPEGPPNPPAQGPQGPQGGDSRDDPQSIPEPGTTLLMLLGGAYAARRARRGAGR